MRQTPWLLVVMTLSSSFQPKPESIRMGNEALKDKIKGGWVGQMIGCAWGGPTEFVYNNVMMKDSEVPVWNSEEINTVFSGLGDDVYVEIPFLEAMKTNGPNCDWNQMGAAFKDTEFKLWHANVNGRDNLRNGLKVPTSGHYLNNTSTQTPDGHSEHDDIDFQIEADFAGIVAPGMPQVAIEIAWRAGHTMNWGNGVYAGVMVAAMHSAAYTARSVSEIIEAGRQSVPTGTRYREMMENVIAWKAQGKTFEENWKLVTDQYKRTTASGKGDPKRDLLATDCDFIDTTQNGAYVLLGLLYGNGDFETSMKLAMQCGGDSDCTPSSVGGILGNYLGYNAIPDQWKSALDYDQAFPYTNYTLTDCIDLSYDLSKRIMKMAGGTVIDDGVSSEAFIIISNKTKPVAFEQCLYRKNAMGLVDSRLAVENAAPILKASVSSQKGATINFSASATDEDTIKEYCWFFGDLSYQKGQVLTHTYRQPGVYNVVCYVSDGLGYTSFEEIEVAVQGL